MTEPDRSGATRLADRHPTISAAEIVANLVPPPQFSDATFDSYRPDPDFATQADAVTRLRDFAEGAKPRSGGGFFGRKKKVEPEEKSGVYLDGGFGVGKTHLLAALWHAASGRRTFGTFIQYTALVGALGYVKATEELRGSSLICIDEFELDDPGDTMMMTRLLGELMDAGTRVAATSNTPPNALGEGRFAAADFLREIQGMSARFETLRIDGTDYRKRDIEGSARSTADAAFDEAVAARLANGSRVTVDAFGDLVQHLGTLHPSTFVRLVADADVIALRDVTPFTSQQDALRFVAFVDRVYDAQVPILASGTPLDAVFPEDMLSGGYRKKYLRATSRLIALTAAEPAGEPVA
jgi:cell division protein ZapE